MSDLIKLPPRISGEPSPVMPDSRHITLIGANGSGKTRFMKAMIESCGTRAWPLSALNAFSPAELSSERAKGSVAELYMAAGRNFPSPEEGKMSEFDMLSFLILHKEFESLLDYKYARRENVSPAKMQFTKLDRLIRLWERIFPGNQILRRRGALLFSTASGDDTISVKRLSQGEKTVLYYILATLYAPRHSVIFVDSPSLFLHPSILNTLWNAIEALRPDCRFVYNTHDVEFISSRVSNVCVWVKRFDVEANAWDYEVCDADKLSDDVFLILMGSRKPVLFIEGDASHSLDVKLYTLVFPDFTVRPLGGCNRVIESTRAFSDLKGMHHLDSHGIVDRDRRTQAEVDYLRGRMVLVPDVAEIENMFLIEDIIRVMAMRKGKKPDSVFSRVSGAVMREWSRHYPAQALLHCRHRVKRLVECKIDGRFGSVEEMETHIKSLTELIRPREIYRELHDEFRGYLERRDYKAVLRVFNHKPLLADCGIHSALGFPSKNAYIHGVLAVLQGNGHDADAIRNAVRKNFGLSAAPNPEEHFVVEKV